MLDPIIDQIFRTARQQGRREPYEAYAFDALLTLTTGASAAGTGVEGSAAADGSAATATACPAVAVDGSADTAEPDAIIDQPAVAPTPPPRVNPRYLALLRVDIEALQRGAVTGQELCEISGVGPVPVSVARGLLGEAVLKLVITRGVDVANVTHLGRGPTAAQRIALAWASPGCTVAGCPRTRVEYDHREPWARTRRTRLDELDPLCEHHHDLKTHRGWAMVPGRRGKRALVPPEDPRHPQQRRARTGHHTGAAPAPRRASVPRTTTPAASAQQPKPALPAPSADPPRPRRSTS